MRAFGVVGDEVLIEVLLHLGEVVIPLLASFDSKMFIKEGAMEAFEEAIALRAPDLGFTVFDFFELKKEFVGVPVLTSAKLPPVV